VLVSAKREGSTITTSVYTDQNGEYFFPAMADGKYDVWAQTLGFKTPRARRSCRTKHQACNSPNHRSGRAAFARCLPKCCRGLPEEPRLTPTQAHFHTTSARLPYAGYVLQFKFDEAGWNKVINLMKFIPTIRPRPQAERHHHFNQKELAGYLARARGPGDKLDEAQRSPRATGEARASCGRPTRSRSTPIPGLPARVKYKHQ